MSALLDVLTLAGGSFLGGFTGAMTRDRRRARAAAPAITRAVCGCGHQLAMHDPETNRCHEVDHREGYNKRGDWAGIDEPCACRQYVGPRPIDQVFLPPSLPSDDAS